MSVKKFQNPDTVFPLEDTIRAAIHAGTRSANYVT